MAVVVLDPVVRYGEALDVEQGYPRVPLEHMGPPIGAGGSVDVVVPDDHVAHVSHVDSHAVSGRVDLVPLDHEGVSSGARAGEALCSHVPLPVDLYGRAYLHGVGGLRRDGQACEDDGHDGEQHDY